MPVKDCPTVPEVPVPLDSIAVTSRLSVSPPVSLAVTPAPAFLDSVAFSLTAPVSFDATGPTPVTVIASSAVSVSPPL